RRTAAGTSRRSDTARGEAASAPSSTHSSATEPVHSSTVPPVGTRPTGTTPSRTSRNVRQVTTTAGSAGDGNGGEDAVEHALRGDPLELGLGTQLQAVPQRRVREGLDVVGGDVRAPA